MPVSRLLLALPLLALAADVHATSQKEKAAQQVRALFKSVGLRPARAHASKIQPLRGKPASDLSRQHFLVGRRLMGSERGEAGSRVTFYLDLIVGSDGQLMTGRYKDYWDFGYLAPFKPISLAEARTLFPKITAKLKQRLTLAFSKEGKWGGASKAKAPDEFVDDAPDFWRGR